jgi:prophage regulatory protein
VKADDFLERTVMEDKQPRRALRLPEVKQKTGLGKTQIFQAVAEGKLPSPFKILPGGRAIAWDEGEINAHLARQMAERKQQSIA